MRQPDVDIASDLSEALSQIKEELRASIAALPAHSKESQLIRCEVPVKPFPLLPWLAKQKSPQKIFWHDREDSVAIIEAAGIGIAERIDVNSAAELGRVFETMRNRLATCDLKARYYGGIRFDTEYRPSKTNEWSAFGVGCFLLPQFEFYSIGLEVFAAGQVVVAGDGRSDIERLFRQIDDITVVNEASNFAALDVMSRADTPGHSKWVNSVRRVLDEIDKGAFEKIVLARACSVQIHEINEPLSLLEWLTSGTSYSTHFAFQMNEQSTFLGSTPELLYKRTGHVIRSEAIAGTRLWGETYDEHYSLGAELFDSPKDRREIDLVRTEVIKSLSPYCKQFSSEDYPHLLPANHVQHLRYLLKGELQDSVTDDVLLAAISPSPAVGGVPRKEAMELIRELEPFDRGWYAGPVGWVSRDSATFAVAIRSALVHGKDIHLYSGAGIVEGSDPESEWSELEAKIKPYLTTLGL